jgi:5-methylcytosine-specific restriction protein B
MNDTWVPFYEEFATKLLGWRDKRSELVDIVLSVYKETGIRQPRLDDTAGRVPTDMDPFTVFGLFNKGITNANRKAIMRALAKHLDIASPVPDEFDGIPVLNNLNATFYRFTNDPARGPHDIDNLWELFDKALVYADKHCSADEFSAAFDAVKDLKGNQWKTTIALYWIRPNTYLSLDQRNRWFIVERSNLNSALVEQIRALKSVPDGATYLVLTQRISESLPSIEMSTLPELTYKVWVVSEQENERLKQGNPLTAIPAAEPARRYWLYSPGAGGSLWEQLCEAGEMSIGWEAIGDPMRFETRDEIGQAVRDAYHKVGSCKNDSLAIWQFSRVMKPGDVVYAKQGKDRLLGRGIVRGEFQYDGTRGAGLNMYRQIEWTNVGSWEYPNGTAPMKTLTDMTSYTEFVASLEELFEGDGPTPELSPYTPDDFLDEVYMTEQDFDTLSYLLRKKKNVILQGPPGTGKTYAGKRLAFAQMGVKDDSRVATVQFHQSYSYEDFIEGYRPNGTGFELRKGPFYKFCHAAQDDPEHDWYFIIDEINRGNISKIFGELFMLLEADKRGVSLKLLYSGEEFTVPPNVHVVGLMNTSDRSLALMDYALRRRFAFYTMEPGFDSAGFSAYVERIGDPAFDKVVDTLKSLNREIADDEMLGENYRIGHSYVCGLESEPDVPGALLRIVRYEITPLLSEYWYDDPARVKEWRRRLESAAGYERP